MKRLFVPLLVLLFLNACGGGEKKDAETTTTPSTQETPATTADDERGIGPIKEVKLSTSLDQTMAGEGSKLYDLKCSSCHRLTNEKLVGPGWTGVTTRRKPEWIMNFATNPDEMLNKDPKAIAMLEECLVRMPNQNVTEKEARALLEFMRKNDGVK